MSPASAARRIISASRRTDIPAYFTDWFCQCLRAGEVLVPNPVNPRQISRIALDPAAVDCFVFWSKDPSPLLARLAEIDDYNYYFQFTLNDYGPAIEPGIRTGSQLIDTFRRLADKVGRQRVIWRYDPIILGKNLTAAWHQAHFAKLAASLADYTELCTISFVDDYARSARGLRLRGQRRHWQLQHLPGRLPLLLRQFQFSESRIPRGLTLRKANANVFNKCKSREPAQEGDRRRPHEKKTQYHALLAEFAPAPRQ